MLQLEEHSYHSPYHKPQLLWRRWRPTKAGMKNEPTRKRGGGMHQLKEVDMLSAKLDLLMEKLDDRAGDKKEVMHIYDSHMTCEKCGDTGHSGNHCPEMLEDVNYIIINNNNNNYYNHSSTKSRLDNLYN